MRFISFFFFFSFFLYVFEFSSKTKKFSSENSDKKKQVSLFKNKKVLDQLAKGKSFCIVSEKFEKQI
jgi:uncharacterized Rossmann fold enzyme